MRLRAKTAMVLASGFVSGCCFTPVNEPVVLAPDAGDGGGDAGPHPDSGLPPPTHCTIDGATYADGDTDPLNPCLYCHVARTTAMWTDAPAGADCGSSQHCFGGLCKKACELDDGGFVPPLTGSGCRYCNEDGHWTPLADGTACTLPGGPSTVPLFCFNGSCGPGCNIDNTYYGPSQLNPQNDCQKCWISSGYSWTDVDPGTPCGMGGVCDLNGSCGPTVCTISSPTGTLEQFPNGTSNPSDPSLCCSTALKIFGWSPRLVRAQNLDTGVELGNFASGDFDGDGWPDLAVISGSPPNQTFTTFMNYQGVLQPAFAFGISAGSVALTAVDLNGDGRSDLIFADTVAETVGVWLSNGDGSFNISNTYSAGAAGHGSLQTADFNGDGIPDLISGFGPIDYFQGLGDGGLVLTQTFNDQATFQQRFALGDLNGDHTPDIAVSEFFGSSGYVTATYGNGSGGFRWSASSVSVDLSPDTLTNLLEGDFDGDGFRDLALETFAGSNSTHTLGFLPGFGDGTFGALRSFVIPNAAGDTAGLAITDLNGDGKNELLFALPVFINPGESTWGLYQIDVTSGAVQAVLPSGFALWPVPGDFNHDGAQDIVGVGDPIAASPGLNLYLNGCP